MGKLTFTGFVPKNDPVYLCSHQVLEAAVYNPAVAPACVDPTSPTPTDEATHRGSDTLEKSLMDWVENGPRAASLPKDQTE